MSGREIGRRASMSAPGGAPTVRRRDQGLREANRTPATEVNPSKAVKKRQRSPGEAVTVVLRDGSATVLR